MSKDAPFYVGGALGIFGMFALMLHGNISLQEKNVDLRGEIEKLREELGRMDAIEAAYERSSGDTMSSMRVANQALANSSDLRKELRVVRWQLDVTLRTCPGRNVPPRGNYPEVP